MNFYELSLSLLFALLLTASCALKPINSRSPSSEEESLSEQDKISFYRTFNPAIYETEHKLELSEYQTYQSSCFQTDYKNWTKPLITKQETEDRFIFLLTKLNRPFYFLNIPSNDSKIHVLGQLNDLKEIICISLTLRNGNTESDTLPSLSTEFLVKAASLENMNSVTLDYIIRFWEQSEKDSTAATQIIRHHLFNKFQAKELIGILFHKPMPSENRLSIIAELLKSAIYRANSNELTNYLIRESSNFINKEERLKIIELQLVNNATIDPVSLFAFALVAPIESYDYSEIYEKLSYNQGPEIQFRVLTMILNQNLELPKAEEYFLNIWNQQIEPSLRETMLNFSLNDLNKSRWMSKTSLFKTTFDGLKLPLEAKSLNKLLTAYHYGNAHPNEVRLKVLSLTSENQILDIPNSELFISSSTELLLNNPSLEVDLLKPVSDVANRSIQNDLVFESYLRFIGKLKNKQNKIKYFQNVLSDNRISEIVIVNIAHDIYDLQNSTSYDFVKKLLQQPQITEYGLSHLLGLALRRIPVSGEDKTILIAISSHPKATQKIRDEVKRAITQKWEYVEEIPH